jgi:hypothetical protein
MIHADTQNTDFDNLMADAARADMALDDRAEAFHLAARELLALHQKINRLQGVSTWVAACDEHGGPDGALSAKRAEVEQAQLMLAKLEAVRAEIPVLRARLDAAVQGVTARLCNDSFALKKRAVTLATELKGAEAAREANISKMIELGTPEATARSVAKPSLGDIAAMRVELRGIPDQQAANALKCGSYVERVKLAAKA